MQDKEEIRRGNRVCTGNQVRSRRRKGIARRWRAGLEAPNKLLASAAVAPADLH